VPPVIAPQTARVKYGRYAVVTGAAAGIGEEFARQLAAAGMRPASRQVSISAN
jgi:NADP-dependent 3-hydroxy acid dehydrogenase YdfG